jgi:hypothetical protein
MQTSVAVLDSALDRVSALDFEIPNPFVNHAPMACEALVALGFEESVNGWVENYEASMGRAVRPVTPKWRSDFEWKEVVGDHRLLPEWMGYFERAIDDHGWRSVVSVWVPRFMPGLVAALFHGVIRTAHAVRALEGVDTPSRRAELSRALANWATWLQIGQPIADIRTESVVPHAAAWAAANAARYYVATPTIFNLHGVTGAMAVDLLSVHLTEAEVAAAVHQLRAEHELLFRGASPWVGEEYREWEDELASAAARSHDSHQVKLVEACRRGLHATGDVAFVLAARTVTTPR